VKNWIKFAPDDQSGFHHLSQ